MPNNGMQPTRKKPRAADACVFRTLGLNSTAERGPETVQQFMSLVTESPVSTYWVQTGV